MSFPEQDVFQQCFLRAVEAALLHEDTTSLPHLNERPGQEGFLLALGLGSDLILYSIYVYSNFH